MSKTYRVTVVDVSSPLSPIAHVAYVSSVKYDGAWKAARGALNADKRGKPVEGYPAERSILYNDEACKDQFTLCGDAVTVGRIDDMSARNVKIDVKALRETAGAVNVDALQSVIDDDDATAEAKAEAFAALRGALASIKSAIGVK